MIPVLSSTEIAQKVKSLAQRISEDYAGKELVVIGVLKGSFIFMADLIRELTIPAQVDFVRLASYGSNTTSSGTIQLTKETELDIRDRDVLIVEDIIDSGVTIAYLLEYLKSFSPKTGWKVSGHKHISIFEEDGLESGASLIKQMMVDVKDSIRVDKFNLFNPIEELF